jgi:hypothetical protein
MAVSRQLAARGTMVTGRLKVIPLGCETLELSFNADNAAAPDYCANIALHTRL